METVAEMVVEQHRQLAEIYHKGNPPYIVSSDSLLLAATILVAERLRAASMSSEVEHSSIG